MRVKYQDTFCDGNGRVVSGGTVTVYEAETTTLKDIYTTETGTTAITGSTVTTATDGSFSFWVGSDYPGIKIVLTKDQYTAATYDNIMPGGGGGGGGGGGDCLYPEDYGGIGDGVNDDTAAVVAAYNALPANGGTICFSNKLWTFNLVILKSGVTLIGSNGNPHQIQQEGGYPGKYWQPYDVSKPVVTVGDDSCQVYNFSARDFAMSGVRDGATRGTAGLKIASSSYHNLSNFRIVGFSSYQLKVGDSTYSAYHTMAGNFVNFHISAVGTANGDVLVQENGTVDAWTTTQNFSNGIMWGSTAGTTNYVIRSANNMYLSNVWVQVARNAAGILLDTTGELHANGVVVEGTSMTCEVVTNTLNAYSIEYHMVGEYQLLGVYANTVGVRGFGTFAYPKFYAYCPVLLGPVIRYEMGFVGFDDNATEATKIKLSIDNSFGAVKNSGTCTLSQYYQIVTTETDHFGTGKLVGDCFVSVGTETCDANNTVKTKQSNLYYNNLIGVHSFHGGGIEAYPTSGNAGTFYGKNGYGVYASTMDALYPSIYGLGITTSVGVMGTSTGSYGGHFSSTAHPGLYASSDTAPSTRMRVNLDGDNIQPILEMYRTNSTDTGAAGQGGSLDFYLRSSAGENRLAGSIWCEWISAADGHEYARICVGTMKDGVYRTTDLTLPAS